MLSQKIKLIIICVIVVVLIAALFVVMFKLVAPLIPFASAEAFELASPPSATVQYRRVLHTNGALTYAYTVTIEKQRLVNRFGESEVYRRAEVLFNTLTEEYSADYDCKSALLTFTLTVQEFSSMTDMYIAMGYDGYYVDPRGDGAHIGFFWNRYTTAIGSPFDTSNALPHALAAEAAAAFDVDVSEVAYQYIYGTKYSFFTIDSDADRQYREGKMYFHEFNVPHDDLTRTFNLVQTVPAQWGWYLIVIMLAALLTCIAIIRAANREGKNGN